MTNVDAGHFARILPPEFDELAVGELRRVVTDAIDAPDPFAGDGRTLILIVTAKALRDLMGKDRTAREDAMAWFLDLDPYSNRLISWPLAASVLGIDPNAIRSSTVLDRLASVRRSRARMRRAAEVRAERDAENELSTLQDLAALGR